MKIYEVHYDNGQTHGDHHHFSHSFYSTIELANNVAKHYNEQPKDIWEADEIYSVHEVEVLDTLPVLLVSKEEEYNSSEDNSMDYEYPSEEDLMPDLGSK